jgi:hypothetical protein
LYAPCGPKVLRILSAAKMAYRKFSRQASFPEIRLSFGEIIVSIPIHS